MGSNLRDYLASTADDSATLIRLSIDKKFHGDLEAMNRGEPQLSITVVPDSGTAQLTGLSRKYEFEYTLRRPLRPVLSPKSPERTTKNEQD